ncbi:MAG: glycerophosphodiester phosphodiesterase [Bacteroidales bacterium]|jgi:glycerophosphoryl diester phosphodiesterase|nr:glycerophosphodiester phosphodiesterase [Bacteroidales bacterium]MCI1784809.1 glycerophosphodiester phosphodiesterase [Bacteroidales bacterium]
MKLRYLLYPFLATVIFTTVSCSKDNGQEPLPDWWFENDSTSATGDDLPEPGNCDNIVVAHRGGSTEAGTTANPDNSIAALRYAMSLKCYASECDIYWTADDNVIVAHGDSNCQINGMYPWEHTVAEIRKAGNLSNGEQISTLGEFLDVDMEAGSCTRLWLDIKNITYPSTLTKYTINACRRACEIIEEKKANKFVEFICTANSTVMASSFLYASAGNINIGWMSNSSAAVYLGKSYPWANLSTAFMTHDGGARTIDEFAKAKIKLSIFVADSDDDMNYYMNNASDLKAITTNYPKKMLMKMGLR